MNCSIKKPIPFCVVIDPEWVIDNSVNSLFNNPSTIQGRVSQVPLADRGLVEEVLRYMFLSNGRVTSPLLTPHNERETKLTTLARYFSQGELHMLTYLTNRTQAYHSSVPATGPFIATPALKKSIRTNLGVAALRRLQHAQFRCEACGMPHVQTLTIDHVNGIMHDRVTLRVLCGNCHLLKSHEDKFGNLRPEPLS